MSFKNDVFWKRSVLHPHLHKCAYQTSPTQVDHPFIVNLRYAFQDDENCFFVLDLMLGGDLRCECKCHDAMRLLTAPIVHLERLGSLPEETVRFYLAQLSSALSFLHEMGIMHRWAFRIPL